MENESVIDTLNRQSADIEMLGNTIDEALEIMVDAVAHLSRKSMGQDNNELAARMQVWMDGET